MFKRGGRNGLYRLITNYTLLHKHIDCELCLSGLFLPKEKQNSENELIIDFVFFHTKEKKILDTK